MLFLRSVIFKDFTQVDLVSNRDDVQVLISAHNVQAVENDEHERKIHKDDNVLVEGQTNTVDLVKSCIIADY